LRKLTFLACLILACLSYSVSLQAQGNEINGFRKNSIYGSVGFAGLYGTATANYERIVNQSPDKLLSASFLKVGYGGYVAYADEGAFIYLQYGILLGKKSSHLELSAGGHYIFDGSMDSPLAATAGYRLQKPGSRFMFRTGIAYPESFYIGIGFSFDRPLD